MTEQLTAAAARTTPSDLDAMARAAWRMDYPTTPYDIWTRTNVGEVFPHVVTPMTWSVYYALGERILGDTVNMALLPPDLVRDGKPPLIFVPIGGRLWYNAGLMHYIATEHFGLPSGFYSLSLGGPREGERLNLPQSGLRPLRLLRAVPGLLKDRRRQESVIKAFHRDAAAMRAETRRLCAEDLSGQDIGALLARIDRVSERASAPYWQLLDGSGAALNAFGALAGLCGRWYGDPALANDLVTGLGELLTAQATVALWQVAQAARENPAARAIVESAPPAELLDRLRAEPGAAPVAAAYERFLADHGHRAADEFELSVPRWSEDQSFVVATLRTYLDAGPEMGPSAHLERQRARRHAAERRAERRLTRREIDRLLPWRRLVFRSVLTQARRLLPLRENPKHHFLMYAAELRRTLLAIGAGLQSAGLIEQRDDVFFLTRDDVARAARGETQDLRPMVAAHRRLYERFLAWDPPEVIEGSDRQAIENRLASADIALPAARPAEGSPSPSADGRRLTGIAASAGVVTAKVRVARTPDEGAELEPGDVLVAPFTDPGWTPLFTVAGAIVMDLGGLLSHGAIVAREYGIPAVDNTRTATTTLQTGQTVTVNGNTGEVTW
jgi:phosphohistidine swiveling domain-containing protein